MLCFVHVYCCYNGNYIHLRSLHFGYILILLFPCLGADSIQIRPSTRTIGKDGEPLKSRGQQVLGDGALVVAYVLFAIAIGSVSIAIYSVISSPLPTLQQFKSSVDNADLFENCFRSAAETAPMENTDCSSPEITNIIFKMYL